jgi:hypothetical protein
MFRDYTQRGNAFAAAVQEVAASKPSAEPENRR